MIVAIALGAYLAMKGYDYDQQRQQEHRATQMLDKIAQEMKMNAGQVSLSLDYHTMVKDTLDFLWATKDSEPLSLRRIPLWKGIQAPQVRDAAYQEAIASHKFDHLSSLLLEQITQIYTLQAELQRLSSPTLEIVLQENLRDKSRRQETHRIIEKLVKDYFKAESNLIRMYDQAFQSIRNSRKKVK
ncbi:hypothetical protein BKI52_41910 [marine bacterium AO1-C]|nr:hypothetical protein BKI52_41910 [marine bacterium AO1-C]